MIGLILRLNTFNADAPGINGGICGNNHLTIYNMEDKYYIECGYSGKKCRIEFDYIDPDMDDLKWTFKLILTFLTYHHDTIKEIFNESE